MENKKKNIFSQKTQNDIKNSQPYNIINGGFPPISISPELKEKKIVLEKASNIFSKDKKIINDLEEDIELNIITDY